MNRNLKEDRTGYGGYLEKWLPSWGPSIAKAPGKVLVSENWGSKGSQCVKGDEQEGKYQAVVSEDAEGQSGHPASCKSKPQGDAPSPSQNGHSPKDKN